ncbi:DUF1360 domain-containing protein [Stenotrophomonas sp. NPDC087984]
MAAFRLNRLLGKASVTSPLRAPFTTYLGPEARPSCMRRPRPKTIRRPSGSC